ncbi:hypothetical protein GCM10022276_28990 [Sphingomonas limnosediminicola]|uniref:Uncharacterized protein n=1 Tax=Sphingomonas limnosediminicola TaxID=940133 RepID=A0ABP7LUJ3_9SPHN
MIIRFAAALALTAAATSLNAQTATTMTTTVDYSIATPIQGNWSYAPVTGGSEATFSNVANQMQLSVRCTVAARSVTISRPATGAAPFLFVWTSTQSRNLPASFQPATARLTANLSAYDQLLDAIAFSRGRFAIGIGAQAAIIFPAWAEVARVVEDCRA